jgi:hypothetical protein
MMRRSRRKVTRSGTTLELMPFDQSDGQLRFANAGNSGSANGAQSPGRLSEGTFTSSARRRVCTCPCAARKDRIALLRKFGANGGGASAAPSHTNGCVAIQWRAMSMRRVIHTRSCAPA